MSKFVGLLAIFYICLSIGLSICKLSGIINISWGLVLCPLWVPIIVLIYAIILIVLIVFVRMLFSK